jgi:carbohydrate kinase (thermoresistant glucokinase family)
MGVSGSGKSSVASLLARRKGWAFAEADTFHSPANVEKMRNGTALTDEDRWPWLDAIAKWIDSNRSEGRDCVVACSALRRVYRERLAGGHRDVRFVYLRGDYDVIATRLTGRTGHYMPVSLLASQFRTLEEPGSDENPMVLSIEEPIERLVDEIAANL